MTEFAFKSGLLELEQVPCCDSDIPLHSSSQPPALYGSSKWKVEQSMEKMLLYTDKEGRLFFLKKESPTFFYTEFTFRFWYLITQR